MLQTFEYLFTTDYQDILSVSQPLYDKQRMLEVAIEHD